MHPRVAAAAADLGHADRWSPANHLALSQLLAADDLAGKVALLDWDNTCIDGDVGDAALYAQLDALLLAAPPHHLEAMFTQTAAALGPEAGARAAALLGDVLVAWRQLWPAVVAGKAESLRHGSVHATFRAKFVALHRLLCADEATRQEAYVLAARLWAGLPRGAPGAVATACCVRAPVADEVWRTDATGRAGPVSCRVRTKVLPFAEMRALLAALTQRGVRCAIVSASFTPLVRAAAAAFAFPVAEADVLGLQLSEACSPRPYVEGAYADALADRAPVTYRAGKVQAAERHGLHAPVLVAGDAITDLEMLTHWPATRVRLLLHRPPGDPALRPLYAAAGAPTGAAPVTLLQGRQDHVGRFDPVPVTTQAPATFAADLPPLP